MFDKLIKINNKLKLFEFYTAEELWNDNYRSTQIFQYHLNETVDVSSRNHQFIVDSVDWIYERFRLGKVSRIADLGCGPGLYSKRFAEKGFKVTGIDFSKNSITDVFGNVAGAEYSEKGDEFAVIAERRV